MKTTILLLAIVALMSCKVSKYAERQENRRMIEETQQHQASLSAHADWTRQYRNWDRRPQRKTVIDRIINFK